MVLRAVAEAALPVDAEVSGVVSEVVSEVGEVPPVVEASREAAAVVAEPLVADSRQSVISTATVLLRRLGKLGALAGNFLSFCAY